MVETTKKLLIINCLIFLFLFVTFYSVWNSANLINNEISFQNYLSDLSNHSLQINPDGTIQLTKVKIIVFPLWTKILMGVVIILILESTSLIYDTYKERKLINN